MQQPVPFVYFHALKVMMVTICALVSYELVQLCSTQDTDPFSAILVSTIVYTVRSYYPLDVTPRIIASLPN